MAKKQSTRSKPKPEKPKRSLKRVEFWLDINDPTQSYLLTLINQFKEERRFAPTLRQGLELVADLQRGSTRILDANYPWVSSHSATLASPDILSQLQRLEQLMESQPIAKQPAAMDTLSFANVPSRLDLPTDFGLRLADLNVTETEGGKLKTETLLDCMLGL